MEPIREPDQQQREDPSLRADIALYDALIASDLPGKVYFDLHVRHQVDVFAWIPGKGRFAFEAKGSLHWMEDGQWRYLDSKHNTSELRSTPADQARSGALAASDALEDRLDGHKPWIHAVLVLTNVPDPDDDISRHAEDRHVHVIWGVGELKRQLQGIINMARDYHPPTELDIEAEAAAFDYRNPPSNWQSRAPAGRVSRTTAGGPPSTKDAESVAAAPCSIVIHNHGTIIIQQPSAHTDRGLLPQRKGFDTAPVAPPARMIPSTTKCRIGDRPLPLRRCHPSWPLLP